jgi:hypothetical protein
LLVVCRQRATIKKGYNMLIGELIVRKDIIDDRIDELEKGLQLGAIPIDNYSTVQKELEDLYDKKRNLMLVLVRHNTSTKITVANSELTITDAIIMRDTVNKNIELLENMLMNGSGNLKIKPIIDKKKMLLEEYILYTTAIKVSDWSTEWED